MEFSRHNLDNGVQVFLNRTSKFRTNLVQLFVHRPLDEHFTSFSLLASVLKRGSKHYPETIDLARRWDDLYGAMFNTQVFKLGEQHVLELRLELPNEKYLKGSESLLKGGMETISEMVASPSLEDGLLRADHVAQEKDALERAINSLFNDKSTYSSVRCIEEMCKDEAYRRLELGDKAELPRISREALTEFYKTALPGFNVWVAITGDIEPDHALSVCEQVLGGMKLVPQPVQTPSLDMKVTKPQTVFEKQPVNQGKLVMGYRTYTTCADADYPALVMCNGILGAFPHSKLFVNVREKASLAYYCSSSLLPVKGLMLIRSGIAFDKFEQALEIIEQQMRDLREGAITGEELENTRLGLINELCSDEDDPARLVRSYLERMVAGAPYDNAHLVHELTRVTLEDVIRVAEKVQLDTVYFLKGKEE